MIPGLGKSPGEGKGSPLQYFGLENSMDCKVHGVTESDSPERLAKKKKRKSALEQEMATHSSVLA